MPATPRPVEITEDDKEQARAWAEQHRPLRQAKGLRPEELERAFEDIYWGASVEEIPQPRYLLDQWIPAGSIVFLTGHGNSGKSLLALAWGQAIARGAQWSGLDVFDPGKVIYLTQEGVSSFQHRIRALMLQRSFDGHTDRFGVWAKTLELGIDSQNKAEGQHWPQLVATIEEHRPRAVVIDPLADYFRPGQENSNDDAKGWINKARRVLKFIEGEGIEPPALIVPAHTSQTNRQGGEIRGATAMYDGADRVYTITPVFPVTDDTGGFSTEGNLLGMKVSTLKSKDGGRPGPWFGEIFEHEVEGALGGTSVTVDGVSKERYLEIVAEAKGTRSAARVDTTEAQKRQAVLEEVRRSPGESWSTVRARVSGNAELLAKVRDELEDEGKIEKSGRGWYVVGQEAPDEVK